MADNLLVVEAMLFSAGRPLHPSDIASVSGLGIQDVRKALKKLHRSYSNRSTSLEIVRTGDKYSMQVKKDYLHPARQLAPTEMPKDLLRTISVIAFNQPILQSNLARRRGPKVYEEVGRLRDMGLVSVKPHGHTVELTTSNRFAEFFGIEAKSSSEVRGYFEKLTSRKQE